MAKFTSALKVLASGLLISLTSCAGMSEGPIPVSANPDPRMNEIRTAMEEYCLNVDEPSDSPDDLREIRNRLVMAYVTATDIGYNAYERDLLNAVRGNETGSSIVLQLLAAIGSVSGDQDVTRAASVTSGVVGGSRDAIMRSLLNQTVSVLQTHMRASREGQYALIVERRGLPYSSWDACMALRDALSYEQAGTLNAALAAMAASAADEEQQNTNDAEQAVRRIAFTSDALSVALRTYLRRGAGQRTTAREALTELITEGAIARPSYSTAQYLGEFQAGGGTAAERVALVRRIVEKEGGSEAGVSLGEALPSQ